VSSSGQGRHDPSGSGKMALKDKLFVSGVIVFVKLFFGHFGLLLPTGRLIFIEATIA
jgi:hypothetical protein